MMSPAVEKLVQDFDHLSASEQQEVLMEVLKRSPRYSTQPVSDAELNALSEELIPSLDVEEQIENSVAG